MTVEIAKGRTSEVEYARGYAIHRVNLRDVSRRDALPLLGRIALDLLQPTIKGRRDGIPKMEEGILLKTNVDKHGFEAAFNVLHAAFEDAANDVRLAGPLDGVFFESLTFEYGYAGFKRFAVNHDPVSFSGIG